MERGKEQTAERPAEPTFFDLPGSVQAAAWICLGFAGFVVWDQYAWWTRRDDYSFGFLVPLFVGYVLFDRWPRIRAVLTCGKPAEADAGAPGGEPETEPRPAPGWLRGLATALFGAAFLLGLLSFGFGALLRATQGPQNAASLAVAWGFAWFLVATVFLFGDRDARGRPIRLGPRLALTGMFLFPAFIWLISAPLLSFLERNLSLFLLDKVAGTVFSVFDLLGIPIAKEGNVLFLGFLEDGTRNEVMVEDACSGIRSLMACLFAGSFLGAVFMKPFWKKVLLVGLAMLLAFLTNILRSFFLTYWAYAHGSHSIQGVVHDVTGYAVLGLTCIGLIALLPLINFRYSDWKSVV